MEETLAYAKSFLGVPYRYGGHSRLIGLDCSNFVCEVLKSAGAIAHSSYFTSRDLYKHFYDPTLANGKIIQLAEPGALVFFGKSAETIDHVGLCLNEKQMIEAAGGDSTTLTLEQAIEKNACVRIRPIKYRRDYFAMLLPNYG